MKKNKLIIKLINKLKSNNDKHCPTDIFQTQLVGVGFFYSKNVI